MQNILFLTHLYPYPPNDGGRMVTFNTIKYLVEGGHRVSLCTFYPEGTKVPVIPCEIDLHSVPLDYRNHPVRIFLNGFSTHPFHMAKYQRKKMLRLIHYILGKKRIDLVYVDHLHMAYYGKVIKKKFPDLRVVLRQHNVESQIMKRAAGEETRLFLKFFLKWQYQKLFQYESRFAGCFDECFMITEEDRRLIKKMNPNGTYTLLPAGVDTDRYKPMEVTRSASPVLVFLGTMQWVPNVNGVLWFLEKVFPSLLEQVPDVRLYIVGKHPPESIRKYQKIYEKSLEVTGFVEDERPYIAMADVFIVPLKIGGGMRIKILNALAMKTPIVTTSIGAEGIHLAGSCYLTADTPHDFLKEVVRLLDQPALAAKLSEQGFKEVRERYDNQTILKKHAKYLSLICKIGKRKWRIS